ncbi:hypothetical protein SAMN06296241_3199 [Salinimicrobium sediminis]|uniref:Uncharacterized protein n=1 Tax=Salinimicrobium sediminis TaxID=1343891 RepID=A0A285X8J9_9FLAO|nr:hypothetical protein SAMN06296241_3199 [Salinimicrobium sediminis]
MYLGEKCYYFIYEEINLDESSYDIFFNHQDDQNVITTGALAGGLENKTLIRELALFKHRT